ncbi:MAG: diguanylate cyclase [Polyangiales bacterium]
MPATRESRLLAEIFLALADVARALVVAYDEVPPESALTPHRQDFARGRSAAEGLKELVRREHDKVHRALEAHTLTELDVSRVRHDVRGQIHAVKGYAEMVLEEMRDDGAPSIHLQASLARIVDTAMRALPHVDRLHFPSLVPADPDEPSSERISHELIQAAYDPDVRYEPRYQGCRVLLIDDSDANRDILSRRLRRAGLVVETAATGEEGLAIASREPVQLVLCDVLMPGMDGYEVLHRLKSDPALHDIPVLMISALRKEETIVRCIEAGADDYLPTPLRATILHARIKACLNRKLLADQDREHAEALAEAREELVSAIESISDGFAIWGSDGRLRTCNQAFLRTYPAATETLRAEGTVESFLRALLPDTLVAPGEPGPIVEPEERLRQAMARHTAPGPHVARLKDGRWIEVTNHFTAHDAVVSVHKDVTSRKRDEERLKYLAMHDPLTGLANRSAFDRRLDEAVAEERTFALLFVDLDRFKDVNDTLGHDAGDRLLLRIAEAIRNAVRTGDLVARVGGDEFAILLLESTGAENVPLVADRILQAIGDSYEEAGKVVRYGATIGIALHPEHSGTPASADLLLQHADVAMYAAKRAGRGRFAYYGAS